MLDWESEVNQGPVFYKFYNPNLHNIARSDSLGFKTKNPNRLYTHFACQHNVCEGVAWCEQGFNVSHRKL